MCISNRAPGVAQGHTLRTTAVEGPGREFMQSPHSCLHSFFHSADWLRSCLGWGSHETQETDGFISGSLIMQGRLSKHPSGVRLHPLAQPLGAPPPLGS